MKLQHFHSKMKRSKFISADTQFSDYKGSPVSPRGVREHIFPEQHYKGSNSHQQGKLPSKDAELLWLQDRVFAGKPPSSHSCRDIY